MKRLFSFLLDLLFPVFCLGCSREGLYACKSCLGKITFQAPVCFVCSKLADRTCEPCRKKSSYIYAFFAPFSYSDPLIRELIHQLKYNRVRGIASEFAGVLANYFDYFKIAVPINSCLISIPLHPRRRRFRGFNQSELIAEAFAKKLDIPLERGVLFKTKNTKPQVEFGRQERIGAAAGAFLARDVSRIQDRTVLLLDDVKTTGATLAEAARALRAAGAKQVWAVAVAR